MSTRPGGPSETTKSAPASGVRAVVLVGFMGAGKSSVGVALSRKLGWPFEDLDERIQAREQRSIEQIFRQSGEAAFRQLEHAALRSLIARVWALLPRSWLLGGGAFAQANNAALLEEAGLSTIFLDAPVEELFRRCQQQQLERPLRGDPGRVPPLIRGPPAMLSEGRDTHRNRGQGCRRGGGGSNRAAWDFDSCTNSGLGESETAAS